MEITIFCGFYIPIFYEKGDVSKLNTEALKM
nr:MAG TPA: hypothetical protein [Bacteriophage sp.]